MNLYATLTALRRNLGLTSTQTGDDDLLLTTLDAAARLIERYTGRWFYPVRQTHTYTVTDPGMLLLGGAVSSRVITVNESSVGACPVDWMSAPRNSLIRADFPEE